MTPDQPSLRKASRGHRRASVNPRQFPLFACGFRPFFLLAAIFAALAVPLWLAAYMGALALPSPLPAPLWHGHEMLAGHAMAVLAGFLLTATPSSGPIGPACSAGGF